MVIPFGSVLLLRTMLRLIKKMNTAIAPTMRPVTSRPSTVPSPVTAPVVSVFNLYYIDSCFDNNCNCYSYHFLLALH